MLSSFLKLCPRWIRNSVRGKLKWQPFFQRLNEIALVGMNYEESFLIEISGELELIRQLHRSQSWAEPCVVFDAGTNVGDYTQAVLETFGGQCRIFGFEPSPAAAEAYTQRFLTQPEVKLFRTALSDVTGPVTLHQDRAGSPVATTVPGALGTLYQCETTTTEVPAETLDEFCERQQIGHVHLLKMDVEGAEYRVLKGAQRLLARGAIEGIQFEFSYGNVVSRVFFRDFYDLLSDQYHLFRIVKDGIYPIDHPYSCEVFRTCNYFARLKRLPPLS